jgi:hypothetical protein
MEGKPDGRRMKPEPPPLTRTRSAGERRRFSVIEVERTLWRRPKTAYAIPRCAMFCLARSKNNAEAKINERRNVEA